MGRRKDPDGKFQPIIGAKFCAAALRSFWVQTAHDNPYADWALLRATQGMQQYGRELQQLTETHLGKLRQMEAKGLTFTVLKSADPKSVSLQFTSPYGFMLAELVVDYDYTVRVIKTAVRQVRYLWAWPPRPPRARWPGRRHRAPSVRAIERSGTDIDGDIRMKTLPARNGGPGNVVDQRKRGHSQRIARRCAQAGRRRQPPRQQSPSRQRLGCALQSDGRNHAQRFSPPRSVGQ